MLDRNRKPVSDYGEALSWLFNYSRVEEWAFEPEPNMPPEARLVADMFWISEKQLCADLRKAWKNALAPSHAPARRRPQYAGWR